MSSIPKIDPEIEREFLQVVKEKYNGDLVTAVTRAFQMFIMLEKQTEEVKAMMEKISDIRGKISDLNSEAAKAMQDIKNIKK